MVSEALRSTPGGKNAPHLALYGLLECGRRERANKADFVALSDDVVVVVALYGLLARSATGKRGFSTCHGLVMAWHGLVYLGITNSSSEKRGKRHAQ